MPPPITDLDLLLRSLTPDRVPGVYVFASLPPGTEPGMVPVVATMREPEGLSVIALEADAVRAGWAVMFRAAWITLTVTSDLHAVGLTAAVATALTRAGISANVVAGACHDHLFVPVDRAEEALAVLAALQAGASLPG